MFRSPYQDEIDKVKKRQKTDHFKKNLMKGSGKLRVFSEVKQNHGLRCAKY